MSTPGPLAPMVAPLVNLAERAHLAAERRAAQWGEAIAAAPAATCPRHPGQPLEKDLGLSAFESDKNHQLTVAHHPCPLCTDDFVRLVRERQLLNRGIPPRSLHVTLSTWDPDWEPTAAAARAQALATVTEWAKGLPSPFLLILGAQGGTGKTALGVAALRAFGSDIRCVEFRDWIGQLGAMDFADRQPALESVRNYDALMIDDLGNRHIGAKDDAGGNNFERDALATVLNWRFEKRMPTIMTSNLDAVQFAGRLDSRTVDRIRAGRVVIDASAWPSRRAAEGI